ncbi:MAG: 3-hydroxyacyl-CoA dehydrogenase [Bacteroidetes bacterium]|nr:MAG: 3-hydroxyacyl-CoA dehydrogenase [Bacteroidota bacterium]
MKIKNVTIAGGGVLGSQIAWQTAFKGFNVIVYDAFEEGIQNCQKYHQRYAELFIASKGSSAAEIEKTFSRLTYTTNLKEAVQDADLVSESVPENLDIKKSFYKELAQWAPERTIFTTNSSTMLPSHYAKETGRPGKFLALHFSNPVWDANVGEVMKHPGTEQKYFDLVVNFAQDIGMVPIPINKEQPGYVLNSLLVPFLSAAQNLWFNHVSDFKSIDKTWMISTGAKSGPFGILDLVGMQTVYNITMMDAKRTNNPVLFERAEKIKTEFIDKGRMGISTGQGFYSYPNPEYKDPDFLNR